MSAAVEPICSRCRSGAAASSRVAGPDAQASAGHARSHSLRHIRVTKSDDYAYRQLHSSPKFDLSAHSEPEAALVVCTLILFLRLQHFNLGTSVRVRSPNEIDIAHRTGSNHGSFELNKSAGICGPDSTDISLVEQRQVSQCSKATPHVWLEFQWISTLSLRR